ncbi:DUF6918 family protein [Nocardia terpenica]|uniref:Uncharacterized protein n=1 Tax=Nocardia terpenica TaxID=455432 RepID=A0A164JWK5_9NOCA|nr:hypothetical protein [Nocardia terpenica]ATL70912.1 hypothetical protein CRH09_36740 [Nocardia terpenica]KZM70793.1 hypothetical protein AWN90_40260 [Nocardia terpenica]MBF6060180.1 hypothetical protein [Nocardia terpenica]MBF6103440.1 hypothetical protein [Nocardia terpenica]MBF6112186.1 hypothetical protein [Nocardia terpenica]
MVAALSESLLDDAKRPAFLADAQKVLDAEVSDKGGASGLAVKGGYAAIKKVSPTIVEDALASFAPKFVDALDPFWAEYQSAGAGSFGDLLVAKQDQVAEALLAVTDARAEASSRPALKKVYSSLRSSAKKHVTEALPRLGDLVQRHAG